jgi:glutamyl-tRNA synthetase
MIDLSFTRTRLAPSPTGSLHLGHARTFLITWWLARGAGAEVILRLEDLDTRRAKPESVRQTYEDLRWLGMDWDAGPSDAGGRQPEISNLKSQISNLKSDERGLLDHDGEYVQSRRRAIYDAALDRLWQSRAIYPCSCSRAEIAASVAQSVAAPQEGDIQIRYPGTCRPTPAPTAAGISHDSSPGPEITRTRQDAAERLHREFGKPVCWRFHVPEEVVSFDDAVHGPQHWAVHADSGDFPVTRFDGTAAYQLAVVVDDAAMGIDVVIRGDDLLSSTPRQLLIYRALGLPEPRFLHVPLVVGPDGKRLAKRHGESRIAQFREQGVTAQHIVGWVAWRSGQIDRPREMDARELVGKFDLARLPRDRVVLTPEDLAWLR